MEDRSVNGRNGRDPDPATLVPRAQRGDREAMELLYRQHVADVRRFTDRAFESREDARDAVQEVFLRMLEALPGYRVNGVPFSSWLLQIAKNHAIDHRRRFARVRPDPEPPGATSAGPGEQTRLGFDQLTSGLTRAQQQVLFLRFACGLPTSDIAVLLGRSEDAVRHVQQRALVKLRAVQHSKENGGTGGNGADPAAVVPIAER